MTKKLFIKSTLILLIFIVAVAQRLVFFDQTGKDSYAYERAVTDLINGINPYKWTIESYSNPNDPGNHGYAYLPGLLYINWFSFVLNLVTKIPFVYLQKIPVLLADIGVGILLIKELHKRSFPAALLALLIWFFNPYFYLKNNYVFTDPLPVFFMLLSIHYLEKDDVLTGAFYAVSIILKTFPILLLPIFLIKSKNKLKFLSAAAIIGLAVSIPFLGDLKTYLNGAVFIHNNRFIQGRPFLFYISYFYKIELFQIIPFKVYTFLSVFTGWFVISLLHLSKLVKDKYILSVIPFLTFYLFTPVLNKTYLTWFIPIFIMGVFNFTYQKNKAHPVRLRRWAAKGAYYLILIGFWIFYYRYLSIWKDGFNIWRPL